MSVQTLNVPAPFIASSDVNYLSSSDIITMRALFKTDFDPNLYGRYSDWDLGVSDLMDAVGQFKGVESMKLQHMEEDRGRSVIHVQAGYSTGSASTTLSVTTSSPNDRFDYPGSGNTIYPSATTKYGIAVKKGDKLEAVVGSTRYYMWVTAVTLAATPLIAVELYDVTSTGAATTFAAGLAGVELFVTGNMGTEAGEPEGTMEQRLIPYTNTMQVSAHEYKYTNSQMLQATMLDGGAKYNYVRGILNERRTFNAIVDLDFLTARPITSSTATFNEVLSYEGLIPFCLNYTNDVTYSSWTLDKFTEMSIALRQNDGPDRVMGLMSAQTESDIEDLFRGSEGLLAGGVIYDSSGSGERKIEFGFKNFTKASVTYNLKSFKAFNDIASLGSTYSPYKDYVPIIPTGTVTAFDMGKNPVMAPAMRMVYPSSLTYHERGYREFLYGGSGTPVPVQKARSQAVIFEQYHSAEFYKPNTYGIFTK